MSPIYGTATPFRLKGADTATSLGVHRAGARDSEEPGSIPRSADTYAHYEAEFTRLGAELRRQRRPGEPPDADSER